MVRVSSPAKLRPWSELTAKMVMGVVPGLVTFNGYRLQILGNLSGKHFGSNGTFFFVPRIAYHSPHKHYRPKNIPGELISVKIAA